jgi:hypothetical protein
LPHVADLRAFDVLYENVSGLDGIRFVSAPRQDLRNREDEDFACLLRVSVVTSDVIHGLLQIPLWRLRMRSLGPPFSCWDWVSWIPGNYHGTVVHDKFECFVETAFGELGHS